MFLPRLDPLGEVVSFQDEMDPVFEQELAQALNSWPMFSEVDLPVQIEHTTGSLEVRMDLTGMKIEKVNTSVDGHTLKIKGEFQAGQEETFREDVTSWKFIRFVELPLGVNISEMNTSLHDGMLNVSIPMA